VGGASTLSVPSLIVGFLDVLVSVLKLRFPG
jgi:hypothetical protein